MYISANYINKLFQTAIFIYTTSKSKPNKYLFFFIQAGESRVLLTLLIVFLFSFSFFFINTYSIIFFFNSPLPSLPPKCWNFFINIYSIIYFSICHYPHYLRLFKIYISTFFSKFFFILNYPHYHRQVETFFSTFIQ